MRRIDSVKEIKKASELKKFMEMRLFSEKKEAELKKHFRDLMGDDELLYIGDSFVAMLEPRERTGLDLEALRAKLGDQIHDFETLSLYSVFSLKENKEYVKTVELEGEAYIRDNEGYLRDKSGMFKIAKRNENKKGVRK